ncbi:hypothetical protein P2318_02615 [Myxococcaceae bacterium GXIMD 01537]
MTMHSWMKGLGALGLGLLAGCGNSFAGDYNGESKLQATYDGSAEPFESIQRIDVHVEDLEGDVVQVSLGTLQCTFLGTQKSGEPHVLLDGKNGATNLCAFQGPSTVNGGAHHFAVESGHLERHDGRVIIRLSGPVQARGGTNAVLGAYTYSFSGKEK